jgi:hypothetical protein
MFRAYNVDGLVPDRPRGIVFVDLGGAAGDLVCDPGRVLEQTLQDAGITTSNRP